MALFYNSKFLFFPNTKIQNIKHSRTKKTENLKKMNFKISTFLIKKNQKKNN